MLRQLPVQAPVWHIRPSAAFLKTFHFGGITFFTGLSGSGFIFLRSVCLCVGLSDHTFMFMPSVPGNPQTGPTIRSADLGPVFAPNEGQTARNCRARSTALQTGLLSVSRQRYLKPYFRSYCFLNIKFLVYCAQDHSPAIKGESFSSKAQTVPVPVTFANLYFFVKSKGVLPTGRHLRLSHRGPRRKVPDKSHNRQPRTELSGDTSYEPQRTFLKITMLPGQWMDDLFSCHSCSPPGATGPSRAAPELPSELGLRQPGLGRLLTPECNSENSL